MKITVLSDNRAKEGFQSEHGLSFFIESDIKNILFDTGGSDIFLRNAEKLRLNVDNADTIVLSHGHFDHGDGLRFIKDKKLICHPDCFVRRYRKNGLSDLGICLTREEIVSKFELIESEKPYYITEDIIFLGQIPRKNNFEAQSTYFITDVGIDDYLIDDSALAVKSDNGLIIITGCSHSGICNITEYAKQVTECKKVYAVIGGFHLKSYDEQTKRTIAYFKNEGVKNVYPSHCTMEPALGMINNEFGMQKVKAGMVFVL